MRYASKLNEMPRGAMYAQRRKNKRRRSFLLISFVLLYAIVLSAGAYFAIGFRQVKPQFGGHIAYAAISSQTKELTSANNSTQGNAQAVLQTLTFSRLAEMSNDHLLLVNNNYKVPSDISGELVSVRDYVWTLNTNSLMNRDALEMLREMFASATNAGHSAFRVTEGYRTYEQQRLLLDSATDSSFVARPGHSEHHTGLAADISYHGVNIANSRQGMWLMENSYRYGFILRYPMHKTDITGFPFEPWHYRFVGQPHAYFMNKNDFVLEEYIGHLRRHREISVSLGGTNYTVFYLTNADESIEIPMNYSFRASLDNTGGIIVTVWP